MKSPVSIALMAAGVAQQAKYSIARFRPSRTGISPQWEGRGGNMSPSEARTPITDPSYWEGRWALCTLTIRNQDGRTLYFPDAVASVRRENRIVQTAIAGMDGTVKEYVNAGDWQLELVLGIQSSEGGRITDEYPDYELHNLMRLLDDNRPLRVHSPFLEIFGIDMIAVKSVGASQATESNYQTVNVSAVSDKDYTIYSTEY